MCDFSKRSTTWSMAIQGSDHRGRNRGNGEQKTVSDTLNTLNGNTWYVLVSAVHTVSNSSITYPYILFPGPQVWRMWGNRSPLLITPISYEDKLIQRCKSLNQYSAKIRPSRSAPRSAIGDKSFVLGSLDRKCTLQALNQCMMVQ